MKQVFITGGAGFIGSNFARYILDTYPEYHVLVFDKLTYAGNPDNLRDLEPNPRFQFVKGDIRDAAAVESAMAGCHYVVSLAAETHVDRSLVNPGDFIQTDVYGTWVLLEAARQHKIERFVQVSSVTGDTPVLVCHRQRRQTRLIPIRDIGGWSDLQEWDVLTMDHDHSLKFKPIRAWISHPVQEVYEITYTGGGQVRATASHSVFVFRGKGTEPVPTSALKPGDCVVTFLAPPVASGLKSLKLRERFEHFSSEPIEKALEAHRCLLATYLRAQATRPFARRLGPCSFKTAHSLCDLGYFAPGVGVTPQAIRDSVQGLAELRWQLVKRRLSIPSDELDLDEDLMEVFGLYLAEGHASHTPAERKGRAQNVTFTVGLQEEERIDLLRRVALRLGCAPSIRRRDSTWQISYCRLWVHRLFSEFGATAYDKHLPDWVWTLPTHLVHALFAGFRGDGHRRPDGVWVYTSVNRSLLESLLWLGRLHGINARINKRTVKQVAHQIPPNGTKTRFREFYDLALSADNFGDDTALWRSPDACCLPKSLIEAHGVRLKAKQLVSKTRVEKLGDVPAELRQIAGSAVGVARIKSIRRLDLPCMVYDLSVADTERFFGGNVPCLLHNTDEVYGSIESGSSRETDTLDPRSPYSASKAGGDLMVRAYYVSHGLPAMITRGSNNFGPYQYPEKMMPLFITNAIEDRPLPLYGDGMYVRDWIYVLDHCAGIDAVLHRGEPGEIYNIGGGNERPNREVTERILDILGKPHSLIQRVRDRPGHDRRYSIDCSKVRALGWQPRHTFDEALEVTVRWYQDNETWWKRIKSGEYREYYEKMYGGREESAGA